MCSARAARAPRRLQLALLIACAALAGVHVRAESNSTCNVPSLEDLGVNPADVAQKGAPGVEEAPEYSAVKSELEALKRDVAFYKNYFAWYNALMSCFPPSLDPVPAWYTINWKCLVDILTTEFCKVPGVSGVSCFADGAGPPVASPPPRNNYLIPETDQYFYQCWNTCTWWNRNGAR